MASTAGTGRFLAHTEAWPMEGWVIRVGIIVPANENGSGMTNKIDFAACGKMSKNRTSGGDFGYVLAHEGCRRGSSPCR